jgi:hypothetical protein
MRKEELLMNKIDISKVANAKWVMPAVAVCTAIGAFMTSMQDQKKEKLIKELVERVTNLENNK